MLLICGASGTAKTKTLIQMLLKPNKPYNKIYFYAQTKYSICNEQSIPSFQIINDFFILTKLKSKIKRYFIAINKIEENN